MKFGRPSFSIWTGPGLARPVRMTNALKDIRNLAALMILFPLIQACSPIGAGTTQAVSLGYGGATDLSSLQGSSTPVLASAPEAIKPKALATIQASGGMEPYSYRLAAGKGKLVNNVYTAPDASEVAAVIVVDKIGQIASVTIMVTPTGEAPIAATPLPKAQPSNAVQTSLPNATVVRRGCDLAYLAGVGVNNGDETMLSAGIHYQHCLIMGRYASEGEHYNWYKNIPKRKLDPKQMPIMLFNTQEFRDRYKNTAMSPQDFIVFASRLLIFRDPTTDEITQLGGAFSIGGQEGVLKAIMASQNFFAVHPFMRIVDQRLSQM